MNQVTEIGTAYPPAASRESLIKSSMSRIAGKVMMTARSAMKVVVFCDAGECDIARV